MFFFNLSLAEFLALFTAAGTVVTLLYLLDRSRRKITVPTLRFWNAAQRPVDSTSRRRIRQWPSLILQLLSIAALIAALSQLRIGQRESASADHVLVLDTSSWMAARSAAGRAPLMEQARTMALDYLRAVPAADRVLLLYADAIATPVTAFETDRRKLEAAIRAARPSDAALDLGQAFDHARRIQARGARRPGEIVFAGAARTAADLGELTVPPNLRLLEVKTAVENVGLRKIGVRHSTSEAGLWNIYVSLKNYGKQDRDADLALNFAGAPVGSRRVRIKAGAEIESAFDYRTEVSGPLTTELRAAGDTFPGDDAATMELPALPQVKVTICSPEPALLRALAESHPSIRPVYLTPGQCTAPVKEGVVVLDRFTPPWKPEAPTLYIEPSGARSPIPLRAPGTNVAFSGWDQAHPVGEGLRTQGIMLASAQLFAPATGDRVVASSAAGPVVVARDGAQKIVVMGFHPMRSAMRYELSTPLLFANILRWMAPAGLQSWELFAGSVGTVSVPLATETEGASARVFGSDARALPFTVQGKVLRFFAGRPGTVRVQSGAREQVHSLTLPAVAESAWEPPASVRRGIPRAVAQSASAQDIWQWLALAGALGLLAEWLWFAPLRHAARMEQPA
ncbi:MAG: VWA domain-containing protein [Acidobacteria bacterium]|nr:VWA domain-containing protein [Acidobacteriota bacterium]